MSGLHWHSGEEIGAEVPDRINRAGLNQKRAKGIRGDLDWRLTLDTDVRGKKRGSQLILRASSSYIV